MGVIGRVRETGRWISTLRRARRGGSPRPAPGPGAPPRPAVRRPDDDPALSTRLGRWRSPSPPEPPAATSTPLGPRERAAAMAQLSDLASRLSGNPAERVGAALAEGSVTVRSLGPQDGHVWELPGMRVFAIVGVQAFTVDDDPA